MIVRGFASPISKELPVEYAVEMNNLINLELEGAIGWDNRDRSCLSHKTVEKSQTMKIYKKNKKQQNMTKIWDKQDLSLLSQKRRIHGKIKIEWNTS